jgi:hypothetical protein
MSIRNKAGDLAVMSVDELKEAMLGQTSVMHILCALTEGLYQAYGQMSPQERTPEVSERWDMLLDLMYHFADELEASEPMPQYGPLALLECLENEGILDSNQRQFLRDDFNAQVSSITPDGLNADSMQPLYKFLVSYRMIDRLKLLGGTPGLQELSP